MFNVDYKKLRLSFNDFHDLKDKDAPEYGEYCLLELKTGDYTAGGWCSSGNGPTGKFIRGTADTVASEEVARWHSLDRYDLTNSLETEGVNWINIGREEEGDRNVQFKGFKSFADRKAPKDKQFCLLIMKDGHPVAAGTFSLRRTALRQRPMRSFWTGILRSFRITLLDSAGRNSCPTKT